MNKFTKTSERISATFQLDVDNISYHATTETVNGEKINTGMTVYKDGQYIGSISKDANNVSTTFQGDALLETHYSVFKQFISDGVVEPEPQPEPTNWVPAPEDLEEMEV